MYGCNCRTILELMLLHVVIFVWRMFLGKLMFFKVYIINFMFDNRGYTIIRIYFILYEFFIWLCWGGEGRTILLVTRELECCLQKLFWIWVDKPQRNLNLRLLIIQDINFYNRNKYWLIVAMKTMCMILPKPVVLWNTIIRWESGKISLGSQRKIITLYMSDCY